MGPIPLNFYFGLDNPWRFADLILFLGTALIGFSLENYLPGGMLAPFLSCFLGADVALFIAYFLGQGPIDLRALLTVGVGAAIGCMVGMLIGGAVGGSGIINVLGPVLGGVGAVLAFKAMISS